MPTQSQNFSNSADGWDITVYWDCDYEDDTAYVYWEVNQNSYSRTFNLVNAANTSTRYNNRTNISVGTSLYLYVYKNGGFSQKAGPFTITAPSRPKYTVKFDANGGSGAPSSQTKTYGYTLTLSSTKPTRTGYNFLGWSTSKTATSPTYYAGGSYTANSGATLYAVWELQSYSVSYNANGGSGVPSRQTKYYGTALKLSTTKPTWQGHTFKEWNTSSSGNGTSYQPGATYSGNAALKLYAIWTLDSYTVSYDANGGSGAPGNQVKYYGQPLTLSTATPVRTGYTFFVWRLNQDGASTSYDPGSQYTGNADATFVALWKANKYKIKFNANGGSGSMSDQDMVYDKAENLTANAFSWAGHTFLGWATSAAGSVVYKDGDSVSNLVSASAGSITLYAVWSINAVTITFDATTNGGSTSEASRSINYGYAIGTLPTATRQYYKFSGWFTAPTGGTKVIASTTFTAATTLYAQFVIDASVKAKVGSQWKPGIPYVKVNGVWKKGYAWAKTPAGWKQGHG